MYKKNCKYCNKEFEIKYKSRLTRTVCSRSCNSLYNLRVNKIITKDKHPLWKGNNVSYNSMHRWRKRNFGNPEKCNRCGILGKYTGKVRKTWNIHWANLDGLYDRLSDSWIGMCVKCHKAFDKNKKKRISIYKGKENVKYDI